MVMFVKIISAILIVLVGLGVVLLFGMMFGNIGVISSVLIEFLAIVLYLTKEEKKSQ